jgi:hypothetical protein
VVALLVKEEMELRLKKLKFPPVIKEEKILLGMRIRIASKNSLPQHLHTALTPMATVYVDKSAELVSY